mgnify:CR=1 FL=1
MEKLRFIADTDWQSNVDGRPVLFLFRLRLLYILLTFFPFIKLDAVTVRVISVFSLITSSRGIIGCKRIQTDSGSFSINDKTAFFPIYPCILVRIVFDGYFPRIAFRRKTVNYSVLGIFQFSRLVCMR